MELSFYNYQTYDRKKRRMSYLIDIKDNILNIYKVKCSELDQFCKAKGKEELQKKKEENIINYTYTATEGETVVNLKDHALNYIRGKAKVIRYKNRKDYNTITVVDENVNKNSVFVRFFQKIKSIFNGV
jgi:predicted glutamine amidotransferase